MPIFETPRQLMAYVGATTLDEMAKEVKKMEVEELRESITQNVYNSFGDTNSLYSGINAEKVENFSSGETRYDVLCYIDESLLAHEYPSYNPSSPNGREDNRIFDSSYGGNIIHWLEFGQNGITPYSGRFFMEKAQVKLNKRVKKEIERFVKANGYKLSKRVSLD